MAEQEVLYNGSSKVVYKGEGEDIIIRFKDYIAAF